MVFRSVIKDLVYQDDMKFFSLYCNKSCNRPTVGHTPDVTLVEIQSKECCKRTTHNYFCIKCQKRSLYKYKYRYAENTNVQGHHFRWFRHENVFTIFPLQCASCRSIMSSLTQDYRNISVFPQQPQGHYQENQKETEKNNRMKLAMIIYVFWGNKRIYPR